jgi:hypothetical protein
MARKNIQDLIAELQSWLPNYDHGPNDYPVLLFRILASLPGGDELEDMGYEPFGLGWHEADQLGRVLEAIQDKGDVEDLVSALVRGEDEELEEAPRRGRRRPAPSRSATYPVSPTGQYVLTRDGREIMRGTEQAIWSWMHANLGYSVEHALRHEGYRIAPATAEARRAEAPRRRPRRTAKKTSKKAPRRRR